MRPLQELLISCQSQRKGLILSLASPRKRRRTRSGSGIARSAARASARVKADGRFAKTLVRIVVRLRSVKEGTVNDLIRHVRTHGHKLARVILCSPPNSPIVPFVTRFSDFFCFLFIPCMYAFSSLSLAGHRFLSFVLSPHGWREENVGYNYVIGWLSLTCEVPSGKVSEPLGWISPSDS